MRTRSTGSAATNGGRILLAALVVAMAATAGATVVVMPDDDTLIAKSPVIVVGTVARSEAVIRSGGIWTETTLDVERVLRGSVEKSITIREVGGVVGDRFNIVFGTPEYKAGERVLVFLWPTTRGDYQTRDLFVGKFLERRANDGTKIWDRSEDFPQTTIVDQQLQAVSETPLRRDAERFEQFIVDRAAGRPANPDYFRQNVQFAPTISAQFTLLKDPEIYRWFAFEEGRAVDWKTVGRPSGFDDAGVNEVKAAIDAWNGAPDATIRYRYAGASNEAPGGLTTPNGINEVLFEDPLDEIDGRWDGSGVLARGGFNNLGADRSWNAPFAADAGHPAGVLNVHEILEGNVVVQNGVSTWSGVGGTMLAEILSHELGHTLGFGHSKESSALMYPTIRSVGPQLRDDDKAAARWLYATARESTPVLPPASNDSVAAEFQISTELPAVNQNVIMADRSSGSPSTWDWSFGDGQISHEQNPSHMFSAPGIYAVTLTASNGSSASSRTRMITVAQAGASFRSLIPAAAQIAGAGATFWRTELSILNPGDETATVMLQYLSSPGVQPLVKTIDLRAGEEATWNNALSEIFGVENGAGAIAVLASASGSRPDLRISSRTYTDGSDGSYGQFVPDTGDYLAATTYLPAVKSTAAFRTNIGLVNRGMDDTAARLTIFDANGTALQTTSITLAAESFRQSSLVSLFPSLTLDGTYSLRIDASSPGSIGAYASVIDNITQDPVFVPARSVPSSNALVLPVAARTPGVASFWRTDVALLNPTDQLMNVTISTLDGRGGKTVSVAAGQTAELGDVLSFIGIEGAAALSIRTDSSAAPVLWSRTYTTRPADGGTYGQAIAAVDPAGFSRNVALTGLQNDAQFRTNIGLVNPADAPAAVHVDLTESGAVIASTDIVIGPRALVQQSVGVLFPAAGNLTGASLRARTDSAAGLLAYGSVVDNRSGDPTFIAGR